MSRTPQSSETPGSLRWVQRMVEHHPDILNQAIGLGPITWKSPLAGDKYSEYCDDEALGLIDVRPSRRPLSDFWSVRGPQWDAIGRAQSGEAVLVEAKAHIPELFSDGCQAKGTSLELISRSLAETARGLGAQPGPEWTSRFYQYASRLAMGHFLSSINQIPTRMVFLYFVGDAEMKGPSTRAEWEAALEVLHEALGIHGPLPPYVKHIFVDVRPAIPTVI